MLVREIMTFRSNILVIKTIHVKAEGMKIYGSNGLVMAVFGHDVLDLYQQILQYLIHSRGDLKSQQQLGDLCY